MTTVAWDGKELVADTQGTRGDTILPGRVQKIFTPAEGEYWEIQGERCIAFALAGMTSGIEAVKDFLRAGITYRTKWDLPYEMMYNALFITESGIAWIQTVAPTRGGQFSSYLELAQAPFSMGSGDNFAFALMSIGKTAQQAVKGASKVCPYTNDVLDVFVLPPAPAVKSVRPAPAAEPKTGTPDTIGHLTYDALKEYIREEMANKPKSPELLEAERDAGKPKATPPKEHLA